MLPGERKKTFRMTINVSKDEPSHPRVTAGDLHTAGEPFTPTVTVFC